MSSKLVAPAGKFIVGEADQDEDSLNQMGEPFNSFEEASAKASELNSGEKSNFVYHVYDECGLV